MRILFLVYHGFSEHSGISKKIHYQVKGLRENGHDVRLCYYDFDERGHRCRFIDGDVITDYGCGMMAGLRQRLDYGCVYDYCVSQQISLVYARCFQNANPWLILFFKKLRNAGIKTVTEIPTYPYDSEFLLADWKLRIGFYVDRLFRRSLYQKMDAIVTFSDAKKIFGQRTIRISNGVDFDSIPLHKPQFALTDDHSPLHLIGVAEVHYWHGYDRLIEGLGRYYKSAPIKREVYFHIVGGVHPNDRYKGTVFHPAFQKVIDQYDISDKVIFHNSLFGEQLTEVFNQCQFAIGSLARHRSGITVIKTLKNREYATRGIPFIYSEEDSDFDDKPYVLKAPADDSPIDIQRIVCFVEQHQFVPLEIRMSVSSLEWKNQMAQVIKEL